MSDGPGVLPISWTYTVVSHMIEIRTPRRDMCEDHHQASIASTSFAPLALLRLLLVLPLGTVGR